MAEILREYPLHTMCHVSHVTCHLSWVTCHLSPVTSQLKKKKIVFVVLILQKIRQSGGSVEGLLSTGPTLSSFLVYLGEILSVCLFSGF